MNEGQKPSFFLVLFVPIFGLFIAVVGVEIGIRFFVPGTPSTGPGWSDRPEFYFASPKVSTMQGMPYTVPKSDGVFRIAVVGDSFTFAPYMQFTDTFAAKLESMLNVQGANRKAEVINYGVPAYSTTHEVPVIGKAIEEGADLLLLQITLNDPEVKAHRPTGIQENMLDKFSPQKPTGVDAFLSKWWRTYAFVRTRLANSASHRSYINYFNDLFEGPRSWNPFSQAMASISKMSRDKGVPIVAVVFPLFGIPMNEKYPFYGIHTKVDQLLTTLNVRHTDISSIYRDIPLERLQVIPGVDRHPNEIAHRMAAEKIYLWLESEKLLPQEFIITERYATRLGTANQRRLAQ